VKCGRTLSENLQTGKTWLLPVIAYPMAKADVSRKGSTSTKTVPAEVKRDLERGAIASKTLSEGLVIDFGVLAANIGLDIAPIKATGVVQRMKEVGGQMTNWAAWVNHPSDTVRGWAAYGLACASMPFAKKLNSIKPLAADPHFGVREWAWLAMREHIIVNLPVALSALPSWTKSRDPNLRRFASEATRPRGVWCAHIDVLKKDPSQALAILLPLRADESKYVRDSVGNWLNDAAKTSPVWVKQLTKQWLVQSPCAETAYIVKRGVRSM
jgi:3-methyladenine DNA glycosylase AlkC